MNAIIGIYTIMFFFGIYFLLLFIILHLRNKNKLYDYVEAKTFPSVSFITPAYNEEKSIVGTLKALLEIDYPKDKKEIIVVNDGSKDNTEKVVREFMKENKEIILINKKNSGKADSLNKAIEQAKGELIAVVDSDSYPTKDSFKKMIGYFEDEKVAAVTSKVWVKNKGNFIERFQDVDYVVIAWSRKILDFIDCVYVTNGPLSVYRKELVKEVGGFDTKNITEDIEMTWNLLSRGYKTKMSYSAKVYTSVPHKFKKWVNQRVRWNIGGLQTLHKYRKFFFRGDNLFGYFIMSYVSLSFLLSLIGFILLARFFYLKFSPYLFSLPYFFQGYNPFLYMQFYFSFTILLILGTMFLALSLFYHKFAVKNSKLKSKSILTIIIYTFIYRPLYLIPLIISLFKLISGDIGWYTK